MRAKTRAEKPRDPRPGEPAPIGKAERVNSPVPKMSAADGKTDLEERLSEAERNLSGSRRRLLDNILREADETFFLSSREMGKRYGVDAATIVRTIQAMGYRKFADFSRDLRNHFVTQITPYTAMRAATRKSRSVADYVHDSVEKDLENLNALKASLNIETIIGLAKRIHSSRRIIVIGIDFAASLAMSLTYGLVRLGCDAEAPVGTTGSVQNKISVMDRKDLLIAISFGRCLRETVEAAKRARQHEVPTFGITDGDNTPIARICDQHIVAPTGRSSFIDSYVAPVAAINAILIACAHTQPKRALKLLEQFDKESASTARWYEGNGTADGKFYRSRNG
jgi:DNA-binding MurR/RpiR family transcriptional regulator